MVIDFEIAFYDVLFGKSNTEALNPTEKAINEQVGLTVWGKERIGQYIKPLPKVLCDLIAKLGEEDITFEDISKVIEKEPSLAGRVVSVANSSYYNRNNQEINSLSDAVSLLGIQGISNIAMTALAEDTIKIEPMYFKAFGDIIWKHSIETAMVSEYFSRGIHVNKFLTYFTCLIHDIGKILIFLVIVESFKRTANDGKPEGTVFKKLMTQYSLDVSAMVAKEWALPPEVIKALEEQTNKPSSALGRMLDISNRVSEIYMLLENNLITEEVAESEMLLLGLSDKDINFFKDLFSNLKV
ncbi:HDOD domain-containing protein [Pleionea sp. CnH1-48]|uniref:HDOD domain-containing protein n=1 Tax=Pleionea sp. CnH1-48 TaxID=2954494 RepID=UPI0020981AAE|nr:HDOD domain-containing protein [Pleionea sp. CnH1-48]MCO7223665.1 HDOD domain-containing protein [Pleionea sp. CnH1-48]